jgi:hypothetical protein
MDLCLSKKFVLANATYTKKNYHLRASEVSCQLFSSAQYLEFVLFMTHRAVKQKQGPFIQSSLLPPSFLHAASHNLWVNDFPLYNCCQS